MIAQHGRADLYPVNLAVHGRFTGASGAWLGPDQGRKTAYVEVVTARRTPGWEPFFRELEDRWLAIDDGLPLEMYSDRAVQSIINTCQRKQDVHTVVTASSIASSIAPPLTDKG